MHSKCTYCLMLFPTFLEAFLTSEVPIKRQDRGHWSMLITTSLESWLKHRNKRECFQDRLCLCRTQSTGFPPGRWPLLFHKLYQGSHSCKWNLLLSFTAMISHGDHENSILSSVPGLLCLLSRLKVFSDSIWKWGTETCSVDTFARESIGHSAHSHTT